MREMDLVMGQFADLNLPTMTDAELDEFERLMEASDPEVLSWITGEARARRATIRRCLRASRRRRARRSDGRTNASDLGDAT